MRTRNPLEGKICIENHMLQSKCEIMSLHVATKQ